MRDERHADAGLSHTRKPGLSCQFADFGFGQSASNSGASTRCCRAACLPGPKIAFVIGIHAVSNGRKAVPLHSIVPGQ